MIKLVTTKNSFAFKRKFFLSAEFVFGIADSTGHIVITINRRQTAFAEKEETLA